PRPSGGRRPRAEGPRRALITDSLSLGPAEKDRAFPNRSCFRRNRSEPGGTNRPEAHGLQRPEPRALDNRGSGGRMASSADRQRRKPPRTGRPHASLAPFGTSYRAPNPPRPIMIPPRYPAFAPAWRCAVVLNVALIVLLACLGVVLGLRGLLWRADFGALYTGW